MPSNAGLCQCRGTVKSHPDFYRSGGVFQDTTFLVLAVSVQMVHHTLQMGLSYAEKGAAHYLHC